MTTPRAALFGKLPSHGDFVARGLPDTARRAWDDYLSANIETSGARLGVAFAAVHDRAPPWRFVVGPGEMGPRWRAGALAPSIDAAGRRFFIMLCVDDLDAEAAALRGRTIAARLEDSIHLAFANGMDADAVMTALEQHEAGFAESMPAEAPMAKERWWIEPAPGSETRVSDRAPDDLIGEAGLEPRETDL
jgi:type VI secretion system protein ImpM